MTWKDEFPKENRYFETENGILYNSDNRIVLDMIPENSIDLVVTSPPYDNLRLYKTKSDDELKNLWNFDVFKDITNKLYKVMKKGGVIVWVVNDATIKGSETGTSFRQALYFKEIGFRLHDTMIYAKNTFSNPETVRYHQVFEYMFILSKGKPKTFNPIKDRKNKYAGRSSKGTITTRQKDGSLKKSKKKIIINKFGMRFNVWKYVIGKGSGQKDKIAYKHPATFPEQLAYDHIVSWSNENDLVLDPFMGSGTVAKVCKQLNRRWIGIELEKEYCDITIKRLEEVK
jgi:site-specific DNA-methyltransferase (adenine-specific)